MSSDILKGNWKQMTGAIQSKWGELTGDEVDQVEGDRERLIGLIQEKYGLAKADAEVEVDRFIADFKSAA